MMAVAAPPQPTTDGWSWQSIPDPSASPLVSMIMMMICMGRMLFQLLRHFYGDQFIADSKTYQLILPGAVTSGDFNYLINPVHTDYKKIKITGYAPFPFDRKIFKT